MFFFLRLFPLVALGDSFFVPPHNVYHVRNLSQHTTAKVVYTIICPVPLPSSVPNVGNTPVANRVAPGSAAKTPATKSPTVPHLSSNASESPSSPSRASVPNTGNTPVANRVAPGSTIKTPATKSPSVPSID